MRKYASQGDSDRTSSLSPVNTTRSHVDEPVRSRPRSGAPLRQGDVMQMQRTVGNRHVQRLLGVRPVQRDLSDGAGAPSGASRSHLPGALQSAIERLSGESMSDVKVHYDSPAPARIDALAYTQGTDIYMGPGQERHLPHEAWHAAQQKQGRVQSTTRAGGQLVNDDTALEREADTMGRRASSLRSEPASHVPSAGEGQGPIVQAARGPGRRVIQMLSETRDPQNGKQIKLETVKWAREWKLALHDDDGKGPEVCSILFKLETSFMGKNPRLSIDTMQAKSRSGGTGTELMGSIPWAVGLIVSHNPLATRLGHVQLHSGFANIIAFQMTVKRYAEALQLRGTASWQERFMEAAAALPEEVESSEVDSSEELAPKSSKLPRQVYDISRFPEMWADTHALIDSGWVDIKAGRLNLTNVDRTISAILSGKGMFDAFHASMDVADLSELSAQVEALKLEAKTKLALEAPDEKPTLEETAL